jgi:hypothetical protein
LQELDCVLAEYKSRIKPYRFRYGYAKPQSSIKSGVIQWSGSVLNSRFPLGFVILGRSASMSTPPAEPKEPESKILHTTRVPPLTGSYEKAHKSYVLFSALLASWQIIGITLETKEKWGLTFKSPNAVPLVLVSLVVYFGYKVTIERMQVEEGRRQNIAAAIDFRVAHALAVVALGITGIQYLLHVQIFDVISHRLTIWVMPISTAMFMFTYLAANFANKVYIQRWVSTSVLNKIVKETFKDRSDIIMMAAMVSIAVVAAVLNKTAYLVTGIAILAGAVNDETTACIHATAPTPATCRMKRLTQPQPSAPSPVRTIQAISRIELPSVPQP